jgi:hypothetical protein
MENVNHPAHYKGKDNPYEAIKVIDAWKLGFCLGNAVKYIARAGYKEDRIEDLKKAIWYLQHEIDKNTETDSINDFFNNYEPGTLQK